MNWKRSKIEGRRRKKKKKDNAKDRGGVRAGARVFKEKILKREGTTDPGKVEGTHRRSERGQWKS